jgi:hypothetical protein
MGLKAGAIAIAAHISWTLPSPGCLKIELSLFLDAPARFVPPCGAGVSGSVLLDCTVRKRRAYRCDSGLI